MSILIFKPPLISISNERLKEEVIAPNFLTISYCYAKDNKLFNYKKIKHEDLEESWKEIESLTEYPVIIQINENDKNLDDKDLKVHTPININKNIVVASCGPVVSMKNEFKDRKDVSDLSLFITSGLRETTKKLPDFLFNNIGLWFINHILCPSAAMVSLNNLGEYSIFNEKNGVNHLGLWVFDDVLVSQKYNQRLAYNEGYFNSDYCD